MDYAEMTDFEINKAVAIARGYAEENCDFGWTGKPDVGVEWSEETGYPTKSFNYCNSWADAGPIIQSSLIDLEAIYEFTDDSEQEIEPTGVWAARGVTKFFVHPRSESANPLRAAMIVFLMMNEAANA